MKARQKDQIADILEEEDAMQETSVDESMDTVVSESRGMAELRNVSGTPQFPIIDGKQITMYPNQSIQVSAEVLSEMTDYLNSFRGGIIVVKIY